MKKYSLILLLSLIVGTASAQKLKSGAYTATISDVKTRSYTQDFYGTIYDVTEYIGNYTIEKGGSQIESHEFSTLQMGKGSMTLHIRSGYPLTYYFDTKKYEIARDTFKAKSSKDIDNIILSGILIYAQWFDEN